MIEARTGLKGSATTFAAMAAASSGATAADVSGFRPSPVAAPSWEGWYAGASLGASWLNSTQDPSGLNIGTQAGGGGSLPFGSTGGTSTTANVPGMIGGLQFGYNWQHANFVYGLETDISWIASNSATSNGNFLFGNRYSATSVTTSSVDALATFRARFGVDFNGTLPYLTVGFALGHLNNNFALSGYNGVAFNAASRSTFGISQSSWVPGVVVGGGIEHQLTRQWTLRGEIMWVGFESQQLGNPLPAVALAYGAINHGGAAKISDNLTLGRVGLNYRF